MIRVNRAAARFTLRTGSAGSKGIVSLPCDNVVILISQTRAKGLCLLARHRSRSKKPKTFALARRGSGTQSNIVIHLRNPRQRAPFKRRQRIIHQ